MPGADTANGSASDSPDAGHDDLSKVELSDLDSSPPQLPIEQDLMQLARLGELRAIQRLFDSGQYNAKSKDDQGITALHSGADVNAKGGDAEATPVLWASKRNNLSVIRLLLSNGADPLAKDDQGYNLLHSATLDGNTFQVVLLLHQPEIPVDVPDSSGHTSLMWAAYKGYPACVDLLLRWGASIHARDGMGFTALHWALVKGSYACIHKLIEYGSDRFAESKPTEGETSGDTPAMTASKMKTERQWHKALRDCGYDENGNLATFPVPFVKDRRRFYKQFFFIWPFILGGLQLRMLAYMPIFLSIPGVLLVGYGLQTLVQQLFKWAPHDLKGMSRVPLLAGIFAGSLFWVGFQYFFHIMPWTIHRHPFFNLAFLAAFSFCTYFYVHTMIADPGFVPKASSRGQTKQAIDDLIENDMFIEQHFCTACLIRKPLRSKHCKRCGRCIAREDHHCPWVDNCIGVNNHKHFVLYLLSLIAGITLFIQLTLRHIAILPEPKELNCAVLQPELCAQWSKDPLTLVTACWASLQLIWTVMLLAAHFTQIARAVTTYESMRRNRDLGPVATVVATGAISAEEANIVPETHAHPHSHKKKEGCLTTWARLFGLDTFFTIAFNGYHGSKNQDRPQKRPNPFYRGLFRNCEDFWLDGPVFGEKQSGAGLVGGERVNYTSLYEVPKAIRSSGYQAVATLEEG